MANKFEKKEWVDRQSQYPSRRKLTATTIENVYEVDRAEGEVTEPGNAFDAQNMNDLEDRIYSALGTLDGTDISILDKTNIFTKTNLEDVLVELFMYASNGKKEIANAIGGSASQSESFQQLADRIKNSKISFRSVNYEAPGSLMIEQGQTSSIHVSCNFGFVPKYIILQQLSITYRSKTSYIPSSYVVQWITALTYWAQQNTEILVDTISRITIKNVTSTGFDIQISIGTSTYKTDVAIIASFLPPFSIIAFG